MLVTKNEYKKDEIVSFKLVNGDEIVAKIVEVTDIAYIILKPTTVIPNGQGLGLLQSLYTGELNNNIELAKSQIMMHSNTVEEIKNYYIETTTGILPVTKGGIIT